MKFLCLVLLCANAYQCYAAPTAGPDPDYRDKYDHLLLEMINERIKSGEAFLEHLSRQLKEFQSTHTEEMRESIQNELDFILPIVKQSEKYFETELKKTGLNLLERYTIEKAKAETELVVTLLTEVQKAVEKKPTFELFAETTDWRNEFDKLLYQSIEEHITQADGMLLFLVRQLDEYTKTKNATLKEHIIKEVEWAKPLLKGADEKVQEGLKRTDLNHLERFMLEKADDDIKLLQKHYQNIETAVNGKTGFYFDDTKTDWHNEYDKLLFQEIESNVRRSEMFLLEVQRQVNKYLESKSADLKTQILKEVNWILPLIKKGIEYTQNEMKRTDLNQIEMYLWEKIHDQAVILQKHLTQIETEMNK